MSELTVTVRQTRDHLAANVRYIASKRVIIPDPLEIETVTLSYVGLVQGDKQELVAVSRRKTAMSWPGEPQTFQVAFVRWILSYDEALGEPVLTVIGIDDFRASQKWQEDCQKEKRRAARIARLKSLFTLQCVSSFWMNLKPNVFGKTWSSVLRL